MHVSHQELLAHHHAIIYAVGAAHDRRLGIPGEDMSGSHSATDFVAWYNGHPDFADRSFDLSSERAVIVGNGNVALDVARILTSDVNALAGTDIADHALDALAHSRIREVVILGRRGPSQAAFSTPELLGLISTPGVEVIVDDLEYGGASEIADRTAPGSAAALKTALLGELAAAPKGSGPKRITLRFFTSPTEILGTDSVEGLRVVRNELEESDGEIVVRPVDDTMTVQCGLVLRSIGYRGRALTNLPFDDDSATLLNRGGRVIDPDTSDPMPGVYTVGWIKRGPSGGIGTNKTCSAHTVAALIDDFVAGRLAEPGGASAALRGLITSRQPEAMALSDWAIIDAYERAIGKQQRRPRVKLTAKADMVAVARKVDAVAG